MILLRSILVFLFVVVVAPVAGYAEQPAPSPKVHELLQLLGDKDVQDWFQTRKADGAEVAPTATRVDPGTALSSRLQEIRLHLFEVARAVPRLPSEIARAAVRLRAATEGYRYVTMVLLAGSFILLGLLAQWLFQRAVQSISAVSQRPEATTPRQRIKELLLELILGIGGVTAFAVGSFGGFLLFQWPDLVRTIVVTMLMAAVAFMIARSLLAILFGPSRTDGATHAADRRLLPMSNEAAGHFRTRLALAVGWYAFGSSFVQVLRLLDVQGSVIELVAYALGLGLLAIGLEAVWRRPVTKTGETADGEAPARTTKVWAWFHSVVFTALWLLWVASAMRLFWMIAVALALPMGIAWSRKVVRHVFRAEPVEEGEAPTSDLVAVTIERALRAGLIAAAIWVLSWAGGIGFESLAASDTPIARIARSLLTVLIVLLVADLTWQLIKTLIDAFLLKAADPGEAGSQEAIRRAKMRTLLPIVRNVAMVFLVTLAILMALSSMGVEIAPLIASAGVVGVAIGFGAQTVVKDVISGMFYLLDDAFRVGEYIITGKFMGTVESFSLRSVRLRHHNGPVFTIPFGELGAVQNMSRDYVIDKFKLTVTYDSDLEKARKLIKKIGEQLMEDEELTGMIIEPMKMQRVDSFGDYGIVLKCKITTRPGEQFMVRKKAFPLIKKLFDENGIEFAFPTVKVAEGDRDSKIAAAQQALAIEASKQIPA